MNKTNILKFLSEFISIQSVSADSSRRGETTKAVNFLTNFLTQIGFTVRKLQKENALPMIVGEYYSTANRRDKSKKTVGIYGHYDVQPEDPVDEWQSPPFKLTLRNGKLFGRGVADNKGHVIQNLIAIKHLIANKHLKNNIVFILEGEEETGSVNLEDYLRQTRDILEKVDVFYITDVGMFRKNVPQIFFGLRGLVYFELTIVTAKRDLHSGVWGNRVLNPALIAGQLIAKFKDLKSDKVLIPGFYSDVRTIPKQERLLLMSVAKSDKEQLKDSGAFKLISQDNKQPYLSAKIYPSLDINGIISGYTGEGAKTVIARSAVVKFSCRLVEKQDPDKIEARVRKFIDDNIAEGVRYSIKILSKDKPFYTDVNNPYVLKTANLLENYFGEKTRFNRTGGSIPVADVLQRILNKPIILTGFTLPDSYIHSPNENFDEEMFFAGIASLEKIYSSI